MSSTNAKKALFTQFAKVAKAMGHGNRLELLELLAQGERGVDELARRAGLSMANTSQHLQHLRRAGLVTARKKAQRVLYRLADEAVVPLLGGLRQIAERQLSEVDRLINTYFKTRDSLEAVSRGDLLGRMRNGLVTVLDVRPPEEFAAGHLPGAVNLPLNELKRRLGALPKNQEIVAYCRGPWCVLAYEAVAEMREHGLTARRLEDGLPEWKLAGLPLEYGSAKG